MYVVVMCFQAGSDSGPGHQADRPVAGGQAGGRHWGG